MGLKVNTHDKIIAGIASRFLDIPTPETRNSDSLDFHEVCVSNLKEALEAAFMAGRIVEARMPTFCPLIMPPRIRDLILEASK